MKVWNVPIEPLEERYSTQWLGWWQKEFECLGVEVSSILSDTLTAKIESGSFLDCFGTNFYKAGQVRGIVSLMRSGEIKTGDVLFFHDLWFPLEQVRYAMEVSGVRPLLAGYLHAGTWDKADLLARTLGEWARHYEQALIRMFDIAFVGSRWHRELLLGIGADGRKVVVCPYPVEVPALVDCGRKPRVVFPHRLAWEKQPEQFARLETSLMRSGLEFIRTADCWNGVKADYYRLLADSRVAVSFARQETFGIAMVEAALLGCWPIVPNALSYVDTFPRECRYDSFEQAREMVVDFSARSEPYVYPYRDNVKPENVVRRVWNTILASSK